MCVSIPNMLNSIIIPHINFFLICYLLNNMIKFNIFKIFNQIIIIFSVFFAEITIQPFLSSEL